jgi:hypothetical protein
MRIGERVRAAHLSNHCPGGLGFPVTSSSALRSETARAQARESWLTSDDHAARAAGEFCARCRQLIAPDQNVRCRRSGDWVHESCPPVTGRATAWPARSGSVRTTGIRCWFVSIAVRAKGRSGQTSRPTRTSTLIWNRPFAGARAPSLLAWDQCGSCPARAIGSCGSTPVVAPVNRTSYRSGSPTSRLALVPSSGSGAWRWSCRALLPGGRCYGRVGWACPAADSGQ